MTSVLWALSVIGFVTTMSLLFVEVMDLSEEARVLTIGGISAADAALLWRSHRRVLQMVALFGTGLAAAIGLIEILPGEPAGWVLALAAWAYGGGVVAAGMERDRDARVGSGTSGRCGQFLGTQHHCR